MGEEAKTRDDPSTLKDADTDFVQHCPGPSSCLTVDPGVDSGSRLLLVQEVVLGG